MSLLDGVRETMRRDRVFDFVADNRFPFQGRRTIDRSEVDISHGPILYLENITVSFDGFKALNDLTLYINAGELRCIIGPNGAGKTTMMDVITGKTRPDEGKVFFGQTMDLSRMTEYEIATAGIGRKFQKPTVFPQHTVFQNLELAMRAKKDVWTSLTAKLNSDQRNRIEEVKEIILALNPDTEGETTSLYLAKLLKPIGIKITRLARGLPIGGDLEFTDEATIGRAVLNRIDI